MDIVQNKKPICNHYKYKMLYMCPSHSDDNHYHCISCGAILPNDKFVRRLLMTVNDSTKVYEYWYPCKRLTDHL